MAREVDEKKTRKALNRLRRAKRAAETAAESGEEDRALSEWESEFVESVEDRLESFGSAFADPEKGAADEALSALQALKLREIEKKAKGKARKPMKRGSGFKSKAPKRQTRSRDIHEDVEMDEAPGTDQARETQEADAPPRPSGPPKLRLVKGGEK